MQKRPSTAIISRGHASRRTAAEAIGAADASVPGGGGAGAGAESSGGACDDPTAVVDEPASGEGARVGEHAASERAKSKDRREVMGKIAGDLL
jgi:hypothetical protein